jgi:Domain of unknown function (DUF222)/HNH endonuclease
MFVNMWYAGFVFVDDLRAAIEANENGVLISGLEDLVEIRRLMDRVEGFWQAEVVECDKRGDAEAVSGLTTINYLARECRQSKRVSRAAVTMAKRLHWAEGVGCGLRDGSLSLGQAQAFSKQLTKRTISLFVEHEAGLLDMAEGLSVDNLETAMAYWRRRADAELADLQTKSSEADRELFVSPIGDTQWALNGTLTAEQGSIVSEAIDAVVQAEWEGVNETRTLPQRRSDALTTICRNFLAVNSEIEIHGTRPHIQVHVQLDDLLDLTNKDHASESMVNPSAGGITDQGSWLDGVTIQRLLCDCVMSRVFKQGSVVLEAGRPSRAIPIYLRRLVIARDQHCRYPGCDCPAAWSEVHHIIYWEHDGEHDLNNLVLLCSRHHQRVHKQKETLTLHPNGQLDVKGATGHLHSSTPPPDTGHLFTRSSGKPKPKCSTIDSTTGQQRIKRVLHALRDPNLGLGLFRRPEAKDLPAGLTCYSARARTIRQRHPVGTTINLETFTCTYETIDGIATLVPS